MNDMARHMERRVITQPVELITRDDAENGTGIRGTAAVFDVDTDLGMFVERIAPGAFDGIGDWDVRGLFNHDPNNLLGRTTAGTLDVEETDDGLVYDIPVLPDTAVGQVVREGVRRGDITGNSFSFTVEEETWDEREGEKPHRTITRVGELFDVGPVTFPAYPSTDVALRALDQFRKDMPTVPRHEWVRHHYELRHRLLGHTVRR